jgi:hypothetical protein
MRDVQHKIPVQVIRRSRRLAGNAIEEITSDVQIDGPLIMHSNQSAHTNTPGTEGISCKQNETNVSVGKRAQRPDGNSIVDNTGTVSGKQSGTTVIVKRRPQRLACVPNIVVESDSDSIVKSKRGRLMHNKTKLQDDSSSEDMWIETPPRHFNQLLSQSRLSTDKDRYQFVNHKVVCGDKVGRVLNYSK